MRKRALASILIIIGLVSLTYAVTKTLIILNEVYIHTMNVEAYWDVNLTQHVTSIDWGTLYPGNTSTVTFYLYNPGNTAVRLTKTVQDWSPSEAVNYMNLTWNPDVSTLEPQIPTLVNVTLTVYESIANTTIDHFTFNINLTATET